MNIETKNENNEEILLNNIIKSTDIQKEFLSKIGIRGDYNFSKQLEKLEESKKYFKEFVKKSDETENKNKESLMAKLQLSYDQSISDQLVKNI